jgi:hypothetical protein
MAALLTKQAITFQNQQQGLHNDLVKKLDDSVDALLQNSDKNSKQLADKVDGNEKNNAQRHKESIGMLARITQLLLTAIEQQSQQSRNQKPSAQLVEKKSTHFGNIQVGKANNVAIFQSGGEGKRLQPAPPKSNLLQQSAPGRKFVYTLYPGGSDSQSTRTIFPPVHQRPLLLQGGAEHAAQTHAAHVPSAIASAPPSQDAPGHDGEGNDSDGSDLDTWLNIQ